MNAISTSTTAPMSSVFALITSLIKSVPNEEFGVISRWMNEEGNRRREHVRAHLAAGSAVVWVNTTGKLNSGTVLEVGVKNVKVRSEHGGDLYVPMARLELKERAEARLSSSPPEIPPPTGVVGAVKRQRRQIARDPLGALAIGVTAVGVDGTMFPGAHIYAEGPSVKKARPRPPSRKPAAER